MYKDFLSYLKLCLKALVLFLVIIAFFKKEFIYENYLNKIKEVVITTDSFKVQDLDPPKVPLDQDITLDYIDKFKDVAINEMRKYSIPASIKLAQGILESNSGQSRLAKENNNHFGMKCFSKNCNKDHCSNFNDDHHKDFFRKYANNWESWRSHSRMIVSGRYKGLRRYGNDYKAWARGLKELGYATDRRYAEKLICTIENYKLYQFDTEN